MPPPEARRHGGLGAEAVTASSPTTVPIWGNDHSQPTDWSLTAVGERLIEAGAAIRQKPPELAVFLNAVMCQVGLPRRANPARTFERASGHASLLLEAGKLYDGRHWIEQPLPYGTIPRLALVHISSEAVRTRRREVEIGSSMRQFLTMLGMTTSGGARGGYRALRTQMNALAACHLTLGMYGQGRAVTIDAKPISRFEAWLHHDGCQRTLWPGSLELSADFFDNLTEHAVPLDPRALAALKHSALALDIYVWLAHRLYRVAKSQGVRLSWQNLRDQFGQEYRTSRDFKKQFGHALHQVCAVYPDARIGKVMGGLALYPSRPPIHRTMISFA